MAKISLICDRCGGNIILDDSHEIGICESCFTQFAIVQDQIIQKITQNIYEYRGKSVEELLNDAYQFENLGDFRKANAKYKQAIDIEPDCWYAWLGYASTGGDRTEYLSIVPAYRKAYSLAANESQESSTFVDMIEYLPDKDLRSSFVRAFNLASRNKRYNIFDLVSGVIGCDESEIASLAVDICPDDWRAYFAMSKFRQIRVKWCTLEGSFFSKHLPNHAEEVLNIFVKTYRLAKNESEDAKKKFLEYVSDLSKDNSYSVFTAELKKAIQKEG